MGRNSQDEDCAGVRKDSFVCFIFICADSTGLTTLVEPLISVNFQYGGLSVCALEIIPIFKYILQTHKCYVQYMCSQRHYALVHGAIVRMNYALVQHSILSLIKTKMVHNLLIVVFYIWSLLSKTKNSPRE